MPNSDKPVSAATIGKVVGTLIKEETGKLRDEISALDSTRILKGSAAALLNANLSSLREISDGVTLKRSSPCGPTTIENLPHLVRSQMKSQMKSEQPASHPSNPPKSKTTLHDKNRATTWGRK